MEIGILALAGLVYLVLRKVLNIKPEEAGEIALAIGLFIGFPAIVLFVVFAG